MAGASASWRAKSLSNPKADGVAGILTMTSNSFKWTANNPNAAKALNVNYRSLRGQRASKEATSKKAILNLLTDSTAVQYFFEFENFVDRDASRNFLAPFLPNGAATTNANEPAANQPSTSARSPGQNESLNQNEMERRIKLLQGDSELQRLHQSLVMNQILSEHDFWASRKKTGDNQKMRTGMASTMLADIRPMADGRSNKVTFNITPEIIHQIFAEKPAVHRAFLSFVPSKMTEIAFWTNYCRNDYLHRTKSAAAATVEAQDDEELAVFVNDDDIIAKEYRRKIKRVDPTLDIAADNADSSVPGHGIYRDRAKDPVDSTARSKLMRDINRHGEVVLEGRLLEDGKNDAMSIAQALAKVQQQDTRVEENEERNRRSRPMTELEDLQGPRGLPSVPLSIQDPRKYFDVQANTTTGASSSSTLNPSEIFQRLRQQIDQFEHQNETAPIIPGALASKVLTELTQQVSSTHHSLGRAAEKNVLDSLPRAVREALLQHSSLINEVLRQFWATCPITSNALLQKANRLKECMSKVYNEIQALKNSVQSEHRHQVSLILQPMFQTLDAALVHYEAEIEKRSSKKLGNGGSSEHANGMVAVK